MNTDVPNHDEIEIDLGELFFFALRKIEYVILAVVLCSVISFAITTWCITPMYTSTAKIYVLNRQSTDTVTSSDITSSTYLTKDYIEMIQSRTVVESVIDELDLDVSYEGLLSVMTVTAESDTRVVSISVQDPDPFQARDIADAICQASVAHIKEIMELESVNIVDAANIPTSKSSPSVTKNVIIGALIGFLISLAVIVVVFLLDDKVKNSEDVERYLGLSVLGMMPLDEKLVREKKKRKRKESRKKGRKIRR
ncbi:MAG: Wzz/FepE/Etk N-terminal domain-containing protein [Lachnospiraceae bacterium]|nr:Wzz/FepE/Etk N-terminal domain-containing protein [Lachnospiraceae bacterium]